MVPDASIWGQFPVLAVVFLALALTGGGLFIFAKWVWGEYCKERDKDRQWRESQNDKREMATREQNQAWQKTVNDMASRWEKQDEERNGVLLGIAEATQRMLRQMDEHDKRAERIERQTRPKNTGGL